MAGPIFPDTAEDAEEFLEKVDEVQRLINGLKAGTISPEYIDTKQKQKEQSERNRFELEKKRPAGRGPTPTELGTPLLQQNNDENDQDAEAGRRDRAMAKVKELMANRDRKLHARARYEEYVKSQDKTNFITDYTKWDIWCPDDEEDDLINSIAPNTPQFKAMEKDIDERHRQMVERRQLAERCRVHGNEAYKACQYSEALRCYQEGIDSERTNMALHANAAMAALKLNCFVQAIEHCDKVLSIAEFLHNNRKDPLCVKALQRRAEAYRGLQQPARAVRDLQTALELKPGNLEVEKQLEKARVEEEEARKQRAIVKAVGRAGGAGASAAAPVPPGEGHQAAVVAAVAGMELDVDKLGRLERLSAKLAPQVVAGKEEQQQVAASVNDDEAESGDRPAHQAGSGEESTISSSALSPPPLSSQQQLVAAGWSQRGPALPLRRVPKGGQRKAEHLNLSGGPSMSCSSGGGGGGGGDREAPAAELGVAGVCSELRELLRGDDVCCVYLRECGGLRHIVRRITVKRQPGRSHEEADLAPLLLLLNDACMNDGNLRQLPALKVLPAVVATLGDYSNSGAAGEAVAAAAVTLLCTAVTQEDVRREVSRLLGTGDGLSRLLGLLAFAKPTVQGIALALLGNCMVDKPIKAAMVKEWRRDSASSSSVADCFLGLLGSRNAFLAEKAAVLLGNMATDEALRTEILARHGGVVKQLTQLACHGGGGVIGGARATGLAPEHGDLDLKRAAMTALYNLTVAVGQQLVGLDAAALTQLYWLAAEVRVVADRQLAARAAGVVARAARTAAGTETLLGLGAVLGMLEVVTVCLDGLEAAGSAASGGGSEDQVLLTWLDAALRILTLLTSPDDAALGAQLVDAGGVVALLRLIRVASGKGASGKVVAGSSSVWLGESVTANAALCLAGLARWKEQLGALREVDPVPVLLGVAYEGRGNTASKNAAIALARLAHDPTMLERLRELHGIEIIYQNVKP